MLKLDLDKTLKILKSCFLFYNYRLGYIGLDRKYFFDYTENTSSNNFAKTIKTIHKEYLTVNWLFDYFNYQFTYWSYYREQKYLKEGVAPISKLHWILGEKALKRYNSRTKKDTYFYHSSFLPKYKITKNEFIKYLEDKELFLEEEEDEEIKIIENPLNEVEEKRKKIRYNTIEGFYNCIDQTSLFKFNSKLCSECNFKNQCKNLLKKRYPNIYQKRLINKIKHSKNG